MDGAREEDSPFNRSFNHFHDPTNAWDKAGLNDSSLGMSSLLFAQNQWWLEPIGNWSWQKAREYYYQALTATDKTTREQNFANTFRALGQIMHLIADSSVPAHTRNDIHVFPLELGGITIGTRTYESWAKKNYRALNYLAIKVDSSIFKQAVSDPSAPVTISALWDQNKYNGQNPEATWSTDPSISTYGISEYTNANFFSEDTIFKNYPHPTKENTTAKLVEQYAKDGKLDRVWYIQGYTSLQLAAYSYLWNYDSLIPKKEWL
ncbi:MAG: hypothetical protein HY805_09435 [Nitrospirae bacterium]|nr:hypothetical protein [Nitrospirota bacterium]